MTKLTDDGRYLQEVSIAEFQAGDINLGNVDVATMPDVTYSGYTYLGEQTIAMNGSAQAATLPEGTNFIEISASGGPVQFTINGTASANSGGYAPQDNIRYSLKVANLTSFSVFGASPAKAHLVYRQEP